MISNATHTKNFQIVIMVNVSESDNPVNIQITTVSTLSILDHYMRREGNVIVGLIFGVCSTDEDGSEVSALISIRRTMPLLLSQEDSSLNISMGTCRTLMDLHNKVYKREVLLGFYTNLTVDNLVEISHFCSQLEPLVLQQRSKVMDNMLFVHLNPEIPPSTPFPLHAYAIVRSVDHNAFIEKSNSIQFLKLSLTPFFDSLSPEANMLDWIRRSEKDTSYSMSLIMDPWISRNETLHIESHDTSNIRDLLNRVVQLESVESSKSAMTQFANYLLKKPDLLDKTIPESFKQDLLMIRYLATLIQVELSCTGRMQDIASRHHSKDQHL